MRTKRTNLVPQLSLKNNHQINQQYGQCGHVIQFPDQNTLNTKVKQIRNPQKEISGGFFCFKIQPSLKKFQQR